MEWFCCNATTGLDFESNFLSNCVFNNRTIIKGTVEDSVVFIISASEFTIDSTDPNNVITGFDVVRQGLTLRNTTSGTDGVTSGAFRFHGTATNADKLNGLPASDYALAGAANFNSIVRFVDAGFTVGDANDLAVYIDQSGSGDEAVVENTVGQKIRSQVGSVVALQQNLPRTSPMTSTQ